MITEETIRAYADLRARKLMFNGAQAFLFAQKVIEHWAAGLQCEAALQAAAKEVAHA